VRGAPTGTFSVIIILQDTFQSYAILFWNLLMQTINEVILLKWKELLLEGYTTGSDVADFLGLTSKEAHNLDLIAERYPMYVNPYYLSLIDPSDPNDPIRRQCIPSYMEMSTDGNTDTSGEMDNTVLQGVQHKYRETALILSTNNCAMYCRHCFRKRIVGIEENETADRIQEAAGYITAHPEIRNVLISGGDAFMNSNDTIRDYLASLTDISHLDLIRFGTRTPVTFPQRITTDMELLDILEHYSSRKQLYIVTQFNHPRELTTESLKALSLIKKRGISIKNQTVLLKGVNDSPVVLSDLLRGLTAAGVIPYYIFQCRPVKGAKNQFQVPLESGYDIVEEAKSLQSGMGKCFRYVMSHTTGKIEILGKPHGNEMLFKYHQAKNEQDAARLFTQKLLPDQCWLPDSLYL